jgi:RNA polymerase sigma-54 factor
MIKSEDPRYPLSDEEIVENFAKIGIEIARRTVAKYRKIENIPSSFDRRKQAKLNGILI